MSDEREEVARYTQTPYGMRQTIDPSDGAWCYYSDVADVTALRRRVAELTRERDEAYGKYVALDRQIRRINGMAWVADMVSGSNPPQPH